MGVVYGQLGEHQKALEHYTRALPLHRAVGDRRYEGLTLLRTGVIHFLSGKPEEALNYLEQALALQRAVGDRQSEKNTLYYMARAERDLGRLDEARAHVEATLDIVEGARSQFFSEQLRTSFSATSQDYYKFYIDLLMSMHRARPGAALDAAALRASERARARGLVELLTESRADIRRGVDGALLERERTLRQQLSVKAERLTRGLAGAQEETAARKELSELLNDYSEVKARIREVSPRYAALTQPRPLTAEEIRKELNADTLLLEYSLGEERSYLWAVTRTSVESFELPKRDEIESRVRLVYDLFTARKRLVSLEPPAKRRARLAEADTAFLSAAGELSRLLLGRLAGRLKHKRLLIVGEGMLQYLPFAALPLPDSSNRTARQSGYIPLITRHEVINLPSASTLSELRKELAGRKPAPKLVAVLADPVFSGNDERVNGHLSGTPGPESPRVAEAKDGGDALGNRLTRAVRDLAADDGELPFTLPRLPYSRQEAEAITALAPTGQSEKALDFDASRAEATNPRLGQYRYVHFATHVVLNTRHPELSGVVLSLVDGEGMEQDGFLLAHEVYNLNLPAELVVLSGCRTGLGKEVRGEGLVGLTRGFMYAGAARVLVSLWDVNDRSTAELMSRFYKGVLGKGRLSPAAALRRAQLQMWRSSYWRAPYYWGAFVLQGEYR